MTLRRGFLAFTAGAVAARTVLPIAARATPAVAPLPDLLDRYNAWLDAERLALMVELYPSWDPWKARRYVPCEPYAGDWWRATPPSSRVLAVLSAAGIYTGPDTADARRLVYGQRARRRDPASFRKTSVLRQASVHERKTADRER